MKRNKKRVLSLILLAGMLLLFVASCDRFDNKFSLPEEDNSFELFVGSFTEKLENAFKTGEFDDVADLYSESYLNDGKDKGEVLQYYINLMNTVSAEVIVKRLSLNKSTLTFSFKIENSSNEIEEIFDEFCSYDNKNYRIIGNGKEVEEPEVREDARILVELFTGTWCPNCPNVESALHNLKQEMGDKFYYLEYHFQDSFKTNHMDLLNYYKLPQSLPISIIQGDTKIATGNQNSYSEYKYALEQKLNKEASVWFENFTYRVDNNSLTFELDIKKEMTISSTFELRWALVDKETTVKNKAGDNCQNVVIIKGSVSLTEDSFTNGITVVIDLPSYTFSKPYVTVWVQNVEQPYNSETSLVYNVKEYLIDLP
jgi:thiol-disulfide isomerase/thioredoxin